MSRSLAARSVFLLSLSSINKVKARLIFIMGWKIIEVESGDSLNLFLNNLVIKHNNDKIIIPINDIDVLLINNYKLKITINLINELAENNVLTIICDNKYLPTSNILPIIGNFNTIKVLDKQINWTPIYKSDKWKQIIKQKIINQAQLISVLKNDSELAAKILELTNDIKEFDVSNREGHAAKMYWHSLFGLNFKRHDDDYCNSLLNYGYTILRSYFTRSIIKKGLDPRISLNHKSYHNYFALASDLMEPFRILIDYEVYKLNQLNEKNFYNHKQTLIECFNKKIFINNKKNFINNAIDIYVDAIVNQDEQLPSVELDYEWF